MQRASRRYVEVCKMIIKGQPFYKKVKFAKRVLKSLEWEEKELDDFLHFICYEDIQKREHYKTNDEIIEIHIQLEKIGKGITKRQEDKEINKWLKFEKEILNYDDECNFYDEMEKKRERFLRS